LAATGLSGATSPVGSRANLRVARPEPPLQQGLWAIVHNQRDAHLRCHDPPHAPPADAPL